MNKYYSWLPSVEKILNQEFIKEFSFLPRSLIVDAIRDILNEYRLLMRNGQCPYDDKDILQEAINKDLVFILQNKNKASFKRVINATGIVLHTNIGRAPISIAAQKALLAAA
ncbi:MAG: L-seryl-tRNA(Sec) selenium transferase, partial [Clostridiales bacterium]